MALFSFEGKKPKIHPKAYIHESAQVIGDVVIGENCFVGAGAIIRGDYGSIRIGDRVAVEEGCVMHAPPGEVCDVGSNILLGHSAMIHCSQVQSNVRVGIGVILAPWAVVEEWIVIGDGSMVAPKKRLASGGVYIGYPAKYVRALSEEDRKGTIRGTKVYADLCDRYRAGLERIEV